MFDIRKILNTLKPENADNEKPDGKKRLSSKQKKLLLSGGGAVVIAFCILLVFVLQGPASANVSGADPAVPSADSQVESQYVENDVFASKLSTGEYSGTVLAKTDDAGVDYVKDTLFIGDSNTAGMINFSKITNVSMNNGIGIVSMGISHVLTLKCVKFRGMAAITVPDAVKILQPRRIVITYGTNDYYMTPEKFAETYKNALEAIEAAYPYADIIIGSIFPITKDCSYHTVTMPTIEKFNVELVNLAQQMGLSFLNWSEALKDPTTGFCKPEYMSGDGVHLNGNGMTQISDYFRTHKLDSEDRRPKPLDPIPVREATPAGLLGVGLPSATTPAPAPTPTPEPAAGPSLVSVTFTAGAGGSLSTGGQSYSTSVAPGATAGPVTATPQSGYVFKGWTGAASSSGQTISFTVPAGATAGTSFVITAVFEAQAAAPPTDQTPANPPGDQTPSNPPGDQTPSTPPTDPGTTPPTDPGTTPPTDPGTTPPDPPTPPPPDPPSPPPDPPAPPPPDPTPDQTNPDQSSDDG